MDALFLISRVVFALVFLLPGIQVHLLQREQAVGMARANRTPLPEVTVPLAGLAIVAGGLMVGLGAWADVGALLLAAFSIGVAPFMHAFWREEDPQVAAGQFAHFMKNIGLAAAALMLFYVYGATEPGAAYSLTGPLLAG